MDNYIQGVCIKYDHLFPTKCQLSPDKHREIIYGAKTQYATKEDNIPLLDDKCVKCIQGIVGSLLYYTWVVNIKLLVDIGTIRSQQAKAMETTAAVTHELLDYVLIHPNNGITYRARNMALFAHSYATYLIKSKACSHAGAYIFLPEDNPVPRINVTVPAITQIIKRFMYSAAEAELVGMFITSKALMPHCQTFFSEWDSHGQSPLCKQRNPR